MKQLNCFFSTTSNKKYPPAKQADRHTSSNPNAAPLKILNHLLVNNHLAIRVLALQLTNSNQAITILPLHSLDLYLKPINALVTLLKLLTKEAPHLMGEILPPLRQRRFFTRTSLSLDS